MTPGEKWEAIPGYEGFYEVSDQGRVRSLDRIVSPGRRRKGKMLRPDRLRKGYLRVSLQKNGEIEKIFVHRLVLLTFVGPCPTGMNACHWNDIPDDNRLENLRWDTPSANSHDALRNGRNHCAKKTHCPRGHEYTPENIYVPRPGHRNCRECRRAQNRAYKLRKAQRARALKNKEADRD